MKTATIILLGSISCLVGCDSKTRQNGDASSSPARPGYFVSTNTVDIKENIRLMCDSLEKKGPTAEYYAFSMNLYRSVTNITDANAAVMAIDEWMDALFQVDLSHLSYKEQAEMDEVMGRFVNNAFGYMKSANLTRAQRSDLGFEKEIEYGVKYLKWKRLRIKCLRPKHRVEDITTVLDIEADRERLRWHHLYYDGMDEYENRLRNIEWIFSYRTFGASSNTVARARAMVEEYIGRPIRTEAQCREDSRLKRHVEYFEKRDPHAAP